MVFQNTRRLLMLFNCYTCMTMLYINITSKQKVIYSKNYNSVVYISSSVDFVLIFRQNVICKDMCYKT